MAIKLKQILETMPQDAILFSTWLTSKGLDIKSQYAYTKSGWLERISKGVYKFSGNNPSIISAVSSYNHQLNKECTIGAYTALDLMGVSHYIAVGKPRMYLFTDSVHRLPSWVTEREWDYEVVYNTSSFLGNGLLGIEKMTIDNKEVYVSSRERAILECLYLPESSHTLLDIYYLMESLTTLRPALIQQLLEACNSYKTKRLFLYMAEKAGYPWYKAIKADRIDIGSSRKMIVPTGKYIRKYNMTIPKELAEYE